MYIEDISSVIFTIGPFAIRWYGLMITTAFFCGFYYLRKYGLQKGLEDDFIFSVFIVMFISIILGARTIYVLANLDYYVAYPEMIIRLDRGGLAFHGGLLGGIISSWLYCRIKKVNWYLLSDLAVPGIAIGIVLVRIANIFNQEILGRETELFLFDRHPAQIYGSLIGVVILITHNYIARKGEYQPGYLFWRFILTYTILRGFIEETFRLNRLVAWGFVNDSWGIGFFTAVHIFTIPIIILSVLMLRKINRGK